MSQKYEKKWINAYVAYPVEFPIECLTNGAKWPERFQRDGVKSVGAVTLDAAKRKAKKLAKEIGEPVKLLSVDRKTNDATGQQYAAGYSVVEIYR